jgi:outer membrane lipase/esterase
MNLLVNGTRRVVLALSLGAAALLSSCGGGTPVVAFVPARVLAFGDENSVITSDGRKFTVNALIDSNGAKVIDCGSNGIWVQRLAASYGLVFPECNPNSVSDPRSRIFAEAGARVADLILQVDQHLATDTFSGTDLVTLFAGQHDVLDQYAQYPGVDKSQLLAAVNDSGRALAAQVSRIAAAGGKVLVSTVPDLGLTPFALKENVGAGDVTRSTFLSALSEQFNQGLRLGLQNENGNQVAIMLTNELVQTMVKFPTNYAGMTNVTDAVCDATKVATVDLCTTDTLVTDGTATSYLWADDTHLSPNGHTYVGSLAASRTRANPF